MTLHHLLAEGTEKLEKSGVMDAPLDARFLLMDAFGLDMSGFLMRCRQELEPSESVSQAETHYWEMIEQREKRVPLQYLLGSQMFMGLDFYVDNRVLIPRQDTEDLAELILKENPQKEKRILDMCTGSGCIAISLAVLGGYEHVTAVDISDGALEVARNNAVCHQVTGRMRFVKSSMFEETEAILGAGDSKYHILVSNPPYIPSKIVDGLQPEVREHEPRLALDGREDGLYFYRILAHEGWRFLENGGRIYLEIGYDQAAAVCGLLKEAGYTEIVVVKDTPGLDRIVKAEYRIA